MKIVIFGANGLTGNELVKQALENEHNVTALARNPSSIEIKYENLAIKQANILSVNSFENTFKRGRCNYQHSRNRSKYQKSATIQNRFINA